MSPVTILIDYSSASFAGANMPTLGSVTLNNVWTYGSLVNDVANSNLVLTDVVVPEPVSAGMIGVALLFLLRCGRRAW